MNIVILGPPGTGKGTIAQFIQKRFGLKQVSTGDLFREEVSKATELGKRVEPVIAKGELVDDATTLEILRKGLEGVGKNGFILDGYPRNLAQAEALDGLAKKPGFEVDVVLYVKSSEEMIVERLSARKQCEKCHKIYGLDIPPKKPGSCDRCGGRLFTRPDDKPKVIRKRFAAYNDLTRPVIEHYLKKGLLVKIDGNRSLQDVVREVERVLMEKEKSG